MLTLIPDPPPGEGDTVCRAGKVGALVVIAVFFGA